MFSHSIYSVLGIALHSGEDANRHIWLVDGGGGGGAGVRDVPIVQLVLVSLCVWRRSSAADKTRTMTTAIHKFQIGELAHYIAFESLA